MIRTAVLAASLTLAASAALAPVAQAQGAPDPAKVEPGTYKLEPTHTQVAFGVLHMGFSEYYGRFSGASGSLTLDPKHPAMSALDVTVPVGSVSTTSDKLNEELRSDQWLDSAKYPDMTFKSTKVVLVGKSAAKVTGDLTLHGVTKPVVLDVKFVGAGTNPIDKAYTVGFSATGEIHRSEFGVKTYVPLIGNAVQIMLSGAFEK